MKRIIILLLFFCAIFLYLIGEHPNPDSDYNTPYTAALKIYNAETSTDAEDSIALQLFKQSITILEKKRMNDSALIDCYIKLGSIFIGLDQPVTANIYFNKVTAFSQKYFVKTEDLFIAHIFSGSTYYAKGSYDSAYYQYKIAEQIGDTTKVILTDRERLYNVMGILYYDYGNYKEATIYFDRALQQLKATGIEKDASYWDLYTKYKINIIACLVKLKKLDAAEKECNPLLVLQTNNANLTSIILYKKATILLELGKYKEALVYMRKVQFNDRSQLKLYNDYSKIFNQLKQYDSAQYYSKKEIENNSRFYPNGANYDLAIAYKNLAINYAQRDSIDRALEYYQQCILKLQHSFTDTSIYANPSNFSGSFSASELFDCLTDKAALLLRKYNYTNNRRDIQASLHTYTAVFSLAEYLENVYTSDDARLFLAGKKIKIHDAPIKICLDLFTMVKDKKYFEQALWFDEQNKNAVLQKGIEDNVASKNARIPSVLVQDEKRYKNNITLLSLKLPSIIDSHLLDSLQKEISNNEFQLGKVKEKMKTYETNALSNTPISLAQLQQSLPDDAGVLSYHLSSTTCTGFFIRRHFYMYKTIAIDSNFIPSLYALVNDMKNPVTTINTTKANTVLYQTLIKPFLSEFKNLKKVTILPDDELHLLPFETIVNKEGSLLVEQYVFNYTNSYKNIFNPATATLLSDKTLAIAPFASNGNAVYAQLRGSNDELTNLKGLLLKDANATKNQFLSNYQQYKILHFATHASVNDSFPNRSNIVFYDPDKRDHTAYLYSAEIANLDLSTIQLAYLSACETGAGKLVKGEGVMSLSRSFAYAGCSNMITSLWQADDFSTAYITNHFYNYIFSGMDYANALQKAKLDYLQDATIEKRKKSPYYWAHLVYIGQVKKHTKSNFWQFMIMGLLFAAPIFYWMYRNRQA
jgi:CHAT domain-containing protein/tetratricopeptide (TPR) repeat protein